MPSPRQLLTRQEFDDWVHDALNRLYDSPYLQTHPLATLLATDAAGIPSQRTKDLRRVLLNAIQARRPAAGSPADSPDSRCYRILQLRYVEGLPSGEVMRRLAKAAMAMITNDTTRKRRSFPSHLSIRHTSTRRSRINTSDQ